MTIRYENPQHLHDYSPNQPGRAIHQLSWSESACRQLALRAETIAAETGVSADVVVRALSLVFEQRWPEDERVPSGSHEHRALRGGDGQYLFAEAEGVVRKIINDATILSNETNLTTEVLVLCHSQLYSFFREFDRHTGLGIERQWAMQERRK